MRTRTGLKWLVLLLLAAAPLDAAEKRDRKQLTVAGIFDSDEFEPKKLAAQWFRDGSAYTTLEDSDGPEGGRDIVRHDPQSGTSRVMVPAAHLLPPGGSAPLKIDSYTFSDDQSLVLIYTNSQRVWRQKTRGDYWVLDRAARIVQQLGGDARPATLMFASFSPDGSRVAYVRANNIYVEDLRDHQIKALTRSGSDAVINGTFDWVYEEELSLRNGFRWSPDSKSIAFWQITTEGVPTFPLINQTDTLYPQTKRFPYPKVGQRNPACRIGVVPAQGGKIRWLKVAGDPRDHYIARMDWAKSSNEILLQQLNRLQNTNRVLRADVRSGTVKTVLTEQDEAWVDVHDELMWFADGKLFTWISERDGWRHIYFVSRSGAETRRVTAGDYDVIQLLHVDEKEAVVYFLASPDQATQQYLYRVALDGSGFRRLTPEGPAGFHSYQIAANGRWAIHRWSSFGVPPQVELIELPAHAAVRTLVDNKALRKKLSRLRHGANKFFHVPIGDDIVLDGWSIAPPKLDATKKYPLLVYVYGEPAGQTVLDRWGGKAHLWHLMLAQRGYFVMSFDNRGTPAPRGRAWRKAVYRKVGILAPAEQAAALRAVLAKHHYLDPKRVAIWGWSGGGSMSLNAIFKYPRLYQTAMAVAPVANERYYDTIYEERYMGLPGSNVEGYIEGSPINAAQHLQGNLLIVHGTGDDNCHYQVTEALINELIRHNKPFTMMAYPNRTHSIREGANTTRHLRALLTRYLLEQVPPGPRGKAKPAAERKKAKKKRTPR
jgi:dipeptidyl-peptidase-4